MSLPAQPGEQARAHPGVLYALVGATLLIWSVNFVVGKVALRHLDALTLATFRVVLAALVMGAVYLASGPRRRPGRADLWKFAQLGLLGVAMNQVLFTVGLNYTTVGHSALIVGAGPIWILLLARAHGLEPLSWKKLVGMLLSFTGVAVLAAEHGFSGRAGTLGGDLITLTGSVAFAFYMVYAKKVALKYDSVEMNLYNYLTGAAIVLPIAMYQGWRLDWGGVPWEGWAALGYMAVFASVVAYLIYYWALGHISASRLGAFGYLLPVMGTLLGILLLGEAVTPHLVVGGGLVLAGVVMTEVGPGGE